MQPTINNLVQLQELYVALDQQKASQPNAKFPQLEDAIAQTRKQLSPAVLAQFDRLIKRNPLAIVPVEKRDDKVHCTACGMALPVALGHQIHAATDSKDENVKLLVCPSCARILFHRDSGAHNIRKSDRHALGLERFSAETLMIPELKATDRDGVLKEFCTLLKEEGFVDNAASLFEAARNRESIVSTAMENGLAFPHVRCVEGGALSLALGISRNGVQFGGDNGALSHIFFFMVIPTASSAYYLKLLSGLSKDLQTKGKRDKLLAAKSGKELWNTLLEITRSLIR